MSSVISDWSIRCPDHRRQKYATRQNPNPESGLLSELSASVRTLPQSAGAQLVGACWCGPTAQHTVKRSLDGTQGGHDSDADHHKNIESPTRYFFALEWSQADIKASTKPAAKMLSLSYEGVKDRVQP